MPAKLRLYVSACIYLSSFPLSFASVLTGCSPMVFTFNEAILCLVAVVPPRVSRDPSKRFIDLRVA
jgi:hypothetical protein